MVYFGSAGRVPANQHTNNKDIKMEKFESLEHRRNRMNSSWSPKQATREWALVPEGRHEAEIVEAGDYTSKSSGKRMYRVVYSVELADGTFGKVFHYFQIYDPANGSWSHKNLLKLAGMAGVPDDKPVESMVGGQVLITVVHNQVGDKTFANVQKVEVF